MSQRRFPRFKRGTNAPAITLTGRDRDILRLIHRHRFLRSLHITALAGGSPQQMLRRLQLLYHHGYVERPRAQLDYYLSGGSRHIVYGLGSRGAALLRKEGVAVRYNRRAKNRAVGRMFIEHALLVSDVIVAIELACGKSGTRLLTKTDLTSKPSFRWRVNVVGRVNLGVVPDCTFALEYQDANGKTRCAHFFLECDRGTMPVIRKNLSQTSIYRKLLAYEATWRRGIHRSWFGFAGFRVLFVTTGAARMQAILDACTKLKHGQGLFLFADTAILEKPANILSTGWRAANGEAASPLS
jgi:hypothetical protein